MAAKAKKSAKVEIENNEDPKEEAPVLMPPEEDVPEPLIEDLPGVGPATAEKLREAGFDDLLALAVMSPGDLADQAELGEAVATKIIGGAKKMANIGGFLSGGALLPCLLPNQARHLGQR